MFVAALNVPCFAGEFEGATGVADVLNWQAGADAAWSLKFMTDDIRKAAEREPHLTYEAHIVGVWKDDFWCALWQPAHGQCLLQCSAGQPGTWCQHRHKQAAHCDSGLG